MKPLFVSFDGPKAVGKTTLLRTLTDRFGRELQVRDLVEKNLDPNRSAVLQLLHDEAPSSNRERRLVDLLARGRQQITRQLDDLDDSGVELILMDRWYPSDAAFRHGIPFSDCLDANLRCGVRRPDLVVAVTCAPQVSWARAKARERGLDSAVIDSEQTHAASTRAFDEAMLRYGWFEVRSERPPEELAIFVEERIRLVLRLVRF